MQDQLSEITDTSSAIIVDQDPRALNDKGGVNRIKNGNIITLVINQHPNTEDIKGGGNTTSGKDVK